ncbi:exopolyphosphatase [Sulfurihydrogenibium azorense Az-Fu1]|uniref:Exopolyphosphatase n=1 Tax=Sulfurihydrogenibium azorense (strain DSM 15241 / OCM 825 / Az-Fu1) TaxID=204536 RepID=C1DTP4_SULAA|nr:Ppx/GppA phosphatase family protein [Sulfurihydrogenibium azorense]ACN98779.1 exopolyphosphatase [Sulfurihydrogenibium azorense Az-Fu1]
MKPKILVLIDIGTYSTRMLIIAVHNDGSFNEIFSVGRITALGRKLKETGYLQKEAMEETLAVLREYVLIAKEYHPDKIVAVATQACREAKNAQEFLEKVKQLGIDVRVITGEEEASLSFLATSKALNIQDKFVVIDQGGGSTEFSYGEKDKLIKAISFPFGIVNLTERFIKSDPPTKQELESLQEFLKPQIETAYKEMKDANQLVGLGGTITTVVALEKNLYPYDSKKVHGSTLTYDSVKKWFEKLSSMTLAQRKSIPMIEDKRAESIISGIAIFKVAMEIFQKDTIRISEWGVRHGLLLSYLQQL